MVSLLYNTILIKQLSPISLNHTTVKGGLRLVINKIEFIIDITDTPDSIPLGDKVIRKTNSVRHL